MARSADPELRQWWRELIDSFDPTRESVATLCERYEVSTASFYAWRRKLAAAPIQTRNGTSGTRPTPGRSRHMPSTAGIPTQHEPQDDSDAFLPLQIVNSQEPGCLRLHLADGMSIELPVGQQQLLFDLVTHLRGHQDNDVAEDNA